MLPLGWPLDLGAAFLPRRLRLLVQLATLAHVRLAHLLAAGAQQAAAARQATQALALAAAAAAAVFSEVQQPSQLSYTMLQWQRWRRAAQHHELVQWRHHACGLSLQAQARQARQARQQARPQALPRSWRLQLLPCL